MAEAPNFHNIYLYLPVFPTEYHLRIIFNHSHCQNIHSQIQNSCFKNFLNFGDKYVPSKRLFAWGGKSWDINWFTLQQTSYNHYGVNLRPIFKTPELTMHIVPQGPRGDANQKYLRSDWMGFCCGKTRRFWAGFLVTEKSDILTAFVTWRGSRG